MRRLCASWNTALDSLQPQVTPDEPRPAGSVRRHIAEEDLAEIPAEDLPPGLPAWMRSLDAWAARMGDDAQEKRATITVSVPRTARTWPT